MTETYRVGPAAIFVADSITDPVEDWVALGSTRGDVAYRMDEGLLAFGRVDQEGGSPRADSVWRAGMRARARVPMLDRQVAVLTEIYPGSVVTTASDDTALGFGNGCAGIGAKAFAIVPLDELVEGSPWWDSEYTCWIPNGVATVIGEFRHTLPEGDDALEGSVVEVEIASLGADQDLAAAVRDAGGIGMIHRLLASENVGVLGLDFLWEPEDGLTPKIGATGTFARASTALYQDAAGVWQTAASGEIRNSHYESGVRTVLLEGQRTNKCQRNYAPDGAGPPPTGWTLTGDPSATLTRVSDATELAAAGLGTLCSDGYVFKLDNSGGTAAAFANGAGVTGNTNTHTVSAWMRGSGTAQVRTTNVGGTVRTLGSSYERYSNALTPAGSSDMLRIHAVAGAVVYFILAQMEEGTFVSSPILNATAASVTRSADSLYFPLPSPAQASQNLTLFADAVAKGIPVASEGHGLVHLGLESNTDPRLVLRILAGGTVVCLWDGGTGSVDAVLAAGVIAGDRVEARGVLGSDYKATAGASVDQGAEATATSTAGDAYGADFSAPRIWVGSQGGSGPWTAYAAFRKVALARRTRTLTELRAT